MRYKLKGVSIILALIFFSGNMFGVPVLKGVMFDKDGVETIMPYLKFNTRETIKLSFDDLAMSNNEFYYTIEHLDYKGVKSRLSFSEYAKGFETNRVYERSLSNNVKTPYTHYELTLPNKDLSILKSGRYKLKLWHNSQKDSILIDYDFFVVENLETMSTIELREPLNFEFLDYGQKLNVKVKTASYSSDMIDRDFKVVVYQNGREVKPLGTATNPFVQGSVLAYTSPNHFNFAGGSDYNVFDTRNLKVLGRGVEYIDLQGDRYSAKLLTDKVPVISHSTTKDNNGGFFLAGADVFNSTLETEYIDVEFSLNAVSTNKTYYLVGDFLGQKITEADKLSYNEVTRLFSIKKQLKQGYYNYSFATKRDDGELEFKYTLGSFPATENSYSIFVYYKKNSERYYRLVDITTYSAK